MVMVTMAYESPSWGREYNDRALGAGVNRIPLVLAAWKKAGFVKEIMRVTSGPGDQEPMAALTTALLTLEYGTPVMIINLETTVITDLEWHHWFRLWVRSTRPLWCTGRPTASTQYLKQVLHVHPQEVKASSVCEQVPVPVWGVFGGVVQEVGKWFVGRERPRDHSRDSIEATLGRAWVQGALRVDDTQALAWVAHGVTDALPAATAYVGPHKRIRRVLPLIGPPLSRWKLLRTCGLPLDLRAPEWTALVLIAVLALVVTIMVFVGARAAARHKRLVQR
jgi:hypothetical protein